MVLFAFTSYMKPYSFPLLFSLKIILAFAAVVLMLQTSSCSKSNNKSGVNYTGSATISEAGVAAAAAAGGKILFAGGFDYVAYTFTKTVDIYDASTGIWSTTQLSEARGGLAGAGVGNKILFAGGYSNNVVSKIVDIYDVTTNSWTTAQLSEARGYLVAAAAGNKVLFAGGQGTGAAPSKTVDIYDVLSDTWTTAQLSEARVYHAAGAAGNKILFAGGTGVNQATKTVDIYDVPSNTWTTAQLSEARFALSGGGIGDKVLFAGGLGNSGISKTVDIYTVSTNTWTTARLSQPRENIAAASAGDKIFFGGGNIVTRPPGGNGNLYDSTVYKTIDIYTASSNRWNTDQLSQPRKNAVAAGSGNKILFAGGATPDSATYAYGIFTQYYSFPKTADLFTIR